MNAAAVPKVSVIVAVYNEAPVIEERLRNLGDAVFPQAQMEIIVASDGSTDTTEEAVSAWRDMRVKLLALPRRGRACAHNCAVAAATGDIVVFTDARTVFEKECLTNLVRPFSDPLVGCVVGRLVYLTERATVAEDTGSYWRYETRVRAWESDAGLLAVGSGCCMAIRRDLYGALRADEDVDDAIPLDVRLRGHRVIFAQDAVAFDVAPSIHRDEIGARARMTVLSLTAILRRRALLNPFRHPRTAIAVVSHRILRSLTPVLVVGGFLSSAALSAESPYGVMFVLQAVLYAVAFFGWVAGGQRSVPRLLRMPLSFVAWNIGFALGLIKVLRGETITSYEPV